MKTTLSITLLFFGTITVAQTTIIAHKSHAGSAETYAFAEPGNFGGPAPKLVTIKKINDTTVVKTYNDWGSSTYSDTVFNDPIFSNPAFTKDSLHQYYYGNPTFINFENIEFNSTKEIDSTVKNTTEPVKVPVEPSTDKNTTRKKRSNSSFWLWLIGGGTFLGVLLSQKRQVPENYA